MYICPLLVGVVIVIKHFNGKFKVCQQPSVVLKPTEPRKPLVIILTKLVTKVLLMAALDTPATASFMDS